MTDENANPLHPLGDGFVELLAHSPGALWQAAQTVELAEDFTELGRRFFPDAQHPRLCLLLDEPGRSAFRCAAAVLLGRTLARRGLRVAILDGDDRQPDLSLWAGRLDREGWIDVLRYGLSTAVASVPVGTEDGVRLFGIGSYHPVRLGTGELPALLERLAPEFDVVVVSLPVGPASDDWNGLAALRILCWDRREQAPAQIETTLHRLEELQTEPELVLVCGGRPILVAPPPAPRGSSPIFRRLAIWLVLLIAAVFVWWYTVVREDRVPAKTADDAAAVVDRPATSPTVAGSPRDSLLAAPLLAAAAGMANFQAAVALLAEETPGDSVTVMPPPADAADPFARVPGAQAWCLHVYSFRDSALAQVELERMERRGVRGLVHHERDGNGRALYRIYAGDFPSREAAGEALPGLEERLRTDWAMPVRTSRLRRDETTQR